MHLLNGAHFALAFLAGMTVLAAGFARIVWLTRRDDRAHIETTTYERDTNDS